MTGFLSNLLGGPSMTSHPMSRKAAVMREVVSMGREIIRVSRPLVMEALEVAGSTWTRGGSRFQDSGTRSSTPFPSASDSVASKNKPGAESTETTMGPSLFQAAWNLWISAAPRVSGFLGRFFGLNRGDATIRSYTCAEPEGWASDSGVTTEEPERSHTIMPELSREAQVALQDLKEAIQLCCQLGFEDHAATVPLIAHLISSERHHRKHKTVVEEPAPRKEGPAPQPKVPAKRADTVISEARKHPKSPFVPSKVPVAQEAPKAKPARPPRKKPVVVEPPRPRSRPKKERAKAAPKAPLVPKGRTHK